MGKLAELREALAKRIFEALTGTAVGDYGTGGDPQLVGYTRLTGMGRDGKLLRDLTPMSQEQMIRIAHFLYAQNPLATRLIDQPIDLAIGSELGYTVEFNHKKLGIDEKRARELAADAKDVLDKFWDHPAHDIRCRANEYMTTLKVTGELCLPIAAENDVDGTPQLDYLDSQLVADVLPLEQSSLVPGTVLVRAKDLGPVTPKTIVRYDPLQDRLVGQCFFWRNGRLLNSMRGRSEFLNIADFLDSFDQFMFSQVDRGVLLNNIVWRLKMEGATEPQLLEAVKKLREQLGKPGGIWAHNEKGELEAVSPDLGSAEGSELLRTLGNHIRGSKGQPESWFGEGGNANRATAGEQTDVSYKGLIALQSLAKKVFGTLLEYAYDNLQVNQEGAGFPKRSTGAVVLTVDLPPVQERDIGRGASALTQLQSALEGAVETELLSKQTARKILIAVVEKVSGHALDADDEEAQIEAESDQREEDAAARAEMMARKGLETALNRGAADGDDKPQPPQPPQANGNGNAREGHISTQALMEAIAKVAGVKPTDVHIHLPETLAASLDMPTPQVTVDVHVPPQPAPQVDVHVEAPAVTVPTPAVVVQVPPPAETVDEIVRGQDGQPEKIIRRQKRDDE